ncbi:hypothetical protein M9H77_08028 [Catharanthus roseus]|uniref:Uncharacterized protein n=1 Tax=Catharanthus roseus TaxID=4058 RepID=A0ACC0BWM1_CATRO|nr:hypothetical protein M9H77_08028 [Catharanthus roseus]
MGNSLGGKRVAKVMKINGEMMKFKTPIYAAEVIKDYPGHVLLESEAVKHYGIRSKPLEPQQELKSKRLYFLVELPKFPQDEDIHQKGPRRVRSGIHMSAKDRLESLMLARRSVSDLYILKPASIVIDDDQSRNKDDHHQISQNGSSTRLKMRLPKAQVEKMMKESKDEAEAAAKIVEFCMANNGNGVGAAGAPPQQQNAHWRADHELPKGVFKPREKRVGFLPVIEGEIQLAVA